MLPESGCPEQATLIPKLRVHFAEFLQHHSPKRLGILYLPTCVGLGYGLNIGAISWNNFAAHTIRSACTTYVIRHYQQVQEY